MTVNDFRVIVPILMAAAIAIGMRTTHMWIAKAGVIAFFLFMFVDLWVHRKAW